MTQSLADGVRSGDRRALARAITLVESTREDHRAEAAEVLAAARAQPVSVAGGTAGWIGSGRPVDTGTR